MNVDTSYLQSISNSLQSYIANLSFENASLQYRHNIIQSKLIGLSNYFNQSASLIQFLENNLQTSYQKGKVTFTHSENLNVKGQFQKKPVTSTMSANIKVTCASASATFNSTFASAGGDISLGEIKAKGSCSLTLWKNKTFDPNVSLLASADASLVSTSVYTKIGTNDIYAMANASGQAGVVYANAKAVLNLNEQTLDLGIGAAAMRGECSFTFYVLGAKVVVTGSGSIGSAEANISYSHKNREWEFGSKLGFIAGLGFDVKVSY